MKDFRSTDVYFGTLDGEDLVAALQTKIRDYFEDIQNRSLDQLWAASYRSYYGANAAAGTFGLSFDSMNVGRGGAHGELSHLKINHYRSLLKHTLQLTTANKPAINCRANNTDSKSQSQTILGNGLVDFYFRERKVGRATIAATETGLVYGESFVTSFWNPNKGAKYAVDPSTGKVVYEGDLDFGIHTPLTVARDTTLTEEDEHDWFIVKTRANKFDLIARYPKFRDDILAAGTKDSTELVAMEQFSTTRLEPSLQDRVSVWTFLHRKTESMPKGRLATFVGDKILLDVGMPYEKLPIARMAPGPLMGTIYGWSPAFDLLAPQHMLDILNSTIATNQSTFGVQNIWTKAGDPIDVTTLAGGMRNFQSDEQPVPIQLTRTAPEIFNYRNEVIQEMETLSGINSVVRGQPEASLKSGAALALVVAQATQFASLLEASVSELVESVSYSIISNLRDFAKTKRVAAIIGTANRSYLKDFVAEDLSGISRVSVEQTNALSKTISGRLELAEKLSERGFVDNAREYLTVLQTGQLEPIVEGTQAELLNIRAENEALRDGKPVQAIVSDRHKDHILEHSAVLSSPEARQNPAIVQATLAHIQEHVNLWATASPAILFATGQEPPPAMQQAAQQPQGVPNASPNMAAAPANPMAAQEPQQPSMPGLPPGAPPDAQAAYERAVPEVAA